MLISDRWRLLTRKVYPEVPPQVEYTLTETGYSLKPVLDAMGGGQNTNKKTAKIHPNIENEDFPFFRADPARHKGKIAFAVRQL